MNRQLAHLLAAPALLLSVSTVHAYITEEFRDFWVTCSNGLTCEADTRNHEQGPLNGLTIRRTAGPETPVSVVISGSRDLAEGSAIDFAVDGNTVASIPYAALVRDPEWSSYEINSADAVPALIDAFRNGSKVTLGYVTEDGPGTTDLSLSGFVASLLKIDEIQGRVGTVDALQAKGDKPPTTVEVFDINGFEAIPASIRSEFEDENGYCGFYSKERFPRLGGFKAKVSEYYMIYGLPCSEGGAYNQPYEVHVEEIDGENEGRIYPLALPVMGQDGPTTEMWAWNVSWDHPKRELEAFFKGRGIGDCGTFIRWRLADNDSGPAFILLEQRTKDECDGDNLGGIENWPAEWPPR